MLSSVCVSYGWISHCLEHDEYLYYYDRWWIDNNDLNQVVASSGFSLSKVGTIYVLIHQVPTKGGGAQAHGLIEPGIEGFSEVCRGKRYPAPDTRRALA